MKKTVVLDVVGLTPELLERPGAARLRAFAKGGAAVPVGGVTPAVTATVQSTYLTGVLPSDHGVVGNGWLFRDTMEVRLWQQSNRLVQAPKGGGGGAGVNAGDPLWWFGVCLCA